jgi:hypothetical protein
MHSIKFSDTECNTIRLNIDSTTKTYGNQENPRKVLKLCKRLQIIENR